jgi:hypothetical protein
LVSGADVVLHPLVGSLEFKPVQPIRRWLSSAEHEIEVPVLVDIYESGEPVVALEAIVLWKRLTDKVMCKLQVPRTSAEQGRKKE